MLTESVKTNNKFSKNLKSIGCISENNLKYFSYDFQEASNLCKFYLLTKIHKRLSDVPGWPVISNFGTPPEKVSEFSDYHLKPIMRNCNSYIRNSSYFLERIKNICSIPDNVMLVPADVVGLYTSIPHSSGLKKVLEKQQNTYK